MPIPDHCWVDELFSEGALHVSKAVRAYQAAHQGVHISRFDVGNVIPPASEIIKRAAADAFLEGKTGYAPPEGYPELRQAIVENVNPKLGVNYSPDEASVQPGGKPVIKKWLETCTLEGYSIAHPMPCYPTHASLIAPRGRKPFAYRVRLNEDKSEYEFDVDALLEWIKITKNPAVILNNHHNPTGARFTAGDLAALAEAGLRYGVVFLDDQAYMDIKYDDVLARSIAAFEGMKDQTVILVTSSKSYAMPGYRIGAALGPEKVIRRINMLNSNEESCTAPPLQFAYKAALEEEKTAGLGTLNASLNERRIASHIMFNRPPLIQVPLTRTTFYHYANVSEFAKKAGVRTPDELKAWLMDKPHITITTMNDFCDPHVEGGPMMARIAYGGLDIDDIHGASESLDRELSKLI